MLQITFHYQTCKCDDEHTVIDDSKKYKKPMELIMGKKFKLEIWENCLKTMKVGEVSSFTVDKSVSHYFFSLLLAKACFYWLVIYSIFHSFCHIYWLIEK